MIGSDPLGKIARSLYEKEGVNAEHLTETTQKATGVGFIIVKGALQILERHVSTCVGFSRQAVHNPRYFLDTGDAFISGQLGKVIRETAEQLITKTKTEPDAG